MIPLATTPSPTLDRALSQAAWRLDGGRSDLWFTAHQMGMTVRGRFPRVEGLLDLHLDRLDDSAIEAVVRTDTVEPAMGALRGLLLSDSFLAAETHPELRFRSGRIEQDGGDAFLVHGQLTFRGATRPITLEARLLAVDVLDAGPFVRIEARGRVDGLIADERLEVELALVAVPAAEGERRAGPDLPPEQRTAQASMDDRANTGDDASRPPVGGDRMPNGAPIRVVALLGSLRMASLNGALLRTVREVAPAGLRIVPFALAGVPFYDGDLEAEGEPEAVRDLKAAIAGADALLIVTPEYNRGLPAIVKNAIDWASRPAFDSPLACKPVLLMGATPGRSAVKHALEEASDALSYTQARPFPTRYGVSRANDLVDEDGLMGDAHIRAELRVLLDDFATAVRRTTAITTDLAA